MINNNECAVFVSSCDAFQDIWNPFFILFFRYWPDCPFPIYLISNYKIYQDERVKTIAVGEDKKWASNLKNVIKQYSYPYLIYFQEDYLLKTKVDTKHILELLEILKNEQAACLRLYPSPGPDKFFKNYKDIGEINKNVNYSFSTQASLWSSKILYNILPDGISGWDMELKEKERVKKISQPFLSVKKNKPAINYFATAIKKGRWYYDAIKLCQKEGIKINKEKRPIEKFSRYVLRKLINIPIFGRVINFISKQ
ncbi:MAG: hypothetical protein ABIG60_02630 [Patescibacteria group bacterium]